MRSSMAAQALQSESLISPRRTATIWAMPWERQGTARGGDRLLSARSCVSSLIYADACISTWACNCFSWATSRRAGRGTNGAGGPKDFLRKGIFRDRSD